MKTPLRRNVGPRALVLALAALLPLAFATPAQAAADTLDQSLVMTFWPNSQFSIPFLAQTFTAGVSGAVDRVSLPVNTANTFAKFTVSIYSVSGNKPTATALGSAPAFAGTLPSSSWVDFTFSPAINVTSGTMYAIVVHSTTTSTAHWSDSGTSDPYANGSQWVGSSATSWMQTAHGDFGFKEFVETNVNTAPALTVAQSAVSVPEGTAPSNAGTCSDPDGDTVTLTATMGTASACSGGKWSWTAAAEDEGPTQTVTITADDGHGLTATTSFTLEVVAVDPVVTIDGVSGASSLVTMPYDVLDFTASFTGGDAGDSYAIIWDFGDGSTASGLDVSHAYAAAGTYAVTLQVSDGEGGVGQATTTVTVQTTSQALSAVESFVQGLSGLNQGEKNSLSAKLQAAAAAAARGDNTAATNELDAFLNELQAYVDSGKVSTSAAAELRTAVETVEGSLGTFNRLVDWLLLGA